MEGRRALWFPCGGVRGSLGVQGGARRRLAVRRGSGRQRWAGTPTAGRDGVNKGFRGGDKSERSPGCGLERPSVCSSGRGGGIRAAKGQVRQPISAREGLHLNGGVAGAQGRGTEGRRRAEPQCAETRKESLLQRNPI